MRIRIEKDRGGLLLRCWGNGYRDGEIAYARLGIQGPRAEIEFPSDWHEYKRAWVRLGIGVASIAFSFPWQKTVPDHGQCSGPTYGFYFFEDHLVLRYGKSTGTRDDPSKFINMPWSWKHREHKVLSEPETHDYTYVRRNGEVQSRRATIKVESRLWTRYWLPYRKLRRYIDIEFNDEVGERSGSWKGGVICCSYDMRPGETPLQTLRRMEREHKFT